MRRIRDENVELPELVHRLLHELITELRLREVARNEHTAATFRFDRTKRLLGIGLLFRQIRDCNVGTFPRVDHGYSTADSRVAAGYERALSVELARGLVLRSF